MPDGGIYPGISPDPTQADVYRSSGYDFPAETIAHSTVAGSLSRQNLDRDLAVEPGIDRTIHNAHATFAGDRKDVEGPQAGSWSDIQEFTRVWLLYLWRAQLAGPLLFHSLLDSDPS